MTEPTALYRLFDQSGNLLYIGITKNPSVRFTHHKMEKPWWPEVDRHDIEWLGSREDALAAEERAIHQDLPIWNVSKSLTRKQAKRTSWRTRMKPSTGASPTRGGGFAGLTFITGRFREALSQRDAMRLELAEAIRAADAEGMPQKDIAEATGYTRQQVRRIIKTEPDD